jgi:hypothetical protein
MCVAQCIRKEISLFYFDNWQKGRSSRDKAEEQNANSCGHLPRILFDKPPVAHPLNNFPTLYETREFMATAPYPEPDESSSPHPTLLL